MSKKCEECEKLLAEALKAIENIGNSSMSKIDARAWHRYFTKKNKKRLKKKDIDISSK